MEKKKKFILPRTGILELKTEKSEDTVLLGKLISAQLKKGDVIFLTGDLGSGKTTFVQGILKGFKIPAFARSSSFVLANEYEIPKKDIKLYHMDLYRLFGDEIEGLGIEEYIYGNGICLIEWADRLNMKRVKGGWEIDISYIDENTREFKIKKL